MGTNVSANLRITHVAVRKVNGNQLIITCGRHSNIKKDGEQAEKGRVFLIWALGTFIRPWINSYTKAFELSGNAWSNPIVCATNWGSNPRGDVKCGHGSRLLREVFLQVLHV